MAPGLALRGLGFVPPVLVAGLGQPPDARTAVLRILPLVAATLLLYVRVMVAQPSVLELIPRFGRQGLTGTSFGLFSVFSGIAAAGGNTVVGWAMDMCHRTGRAWLSWVCRLVFGLASAAGAAWLHRLRALPGEHPAALSTA